MPLYKERKGIGSKTIARLRATGMSLSQLEGMIIRQNAAYPLIGGAISILPVAACQALFDYVTRQIESGIWSGSYMIVNGESTAEWYHSLPYAYSLWSHNPVLVLICNVLFFEALMLLATLPQILYLKKQVIAENIDVDSF